MNKRQSKESFKMNQVLSKGTFKTNSNENMIQETLQNYQMLSKTGDSCPFCSCKHIILSSLNSLKLIIEAKNEKIRQLQCFIQKISKMAFHQEVESKCPEYYSLQQKQIEQNLHIEPLKQTKFFNQIQQSDQIREVQIEENKEQHIPMKHSMSSKTSFQRIDSKESMEQHARVSIKQYIKNLNLNFNKQNSENQTEPDTNDSILRRKLIQIINILPKNTSNSDLHSYETLSEPLQQGSAGLMNSKCSTNKKIKKGGFLNNEDNIMQTIPNKQLKSRKELN